MDDGALESFEIGDVGDERFVVVIVARSHTDITSIVSLVL